VRQPNVRPITKNTRARTAIATALPLLALGSSCGISSIDPQPEPIALPFVVSDYYSPDGYWGDGETRGYLDLQKVCPQRAPGATGDCYTITYAPGPRRFAGINWQYPHNNWGFSRGRNIAAGAVRISVQARGVVGGEVVSFGAGQVGSANPFNDAFSLSPISAALTTGWTTTELPFGAATYGGTQGVLAAFVISLTAGASDATSVFYLDDIRWLP
jgi:hypothetical protein